MPNFFKDLVKELNDDFTNLADSGANSSEYSGCIDSGSYILNAALTGSLYGGVPNNDHQLCIESPCCIYRRAISYET